MNSTIKDFIAPKQYSFDIRHAIDNQKIILVEVQKGDVASMAGSIITTQIWAAAQSPIKQPKKNVKSSTYTSTSSQTSPPKAATSPPSSAKSGNSDSDAG